MRKKTLITGVLGQDGPYLAKLLLEKDYKVYGMIQQNKTHNFYNTDYLKITHEIEFVTGDMTDESSLTQLIKKIRPDEIYNFAAKSSVGSSWTEAKLTTEVNALGLLYLLNVIKIFCPRTKLYQASTSEIFGNQKNIITEKTPANPRSPYAISKLYAYWMTQTFKESYGLFCVNGILFNHESPLRGINFVTRKITDGVARIKFGLAEKLVLGNLEAKRDWGYAGDYMEAIWLMLQQKKPDDYIVCTGETHSVKNFLQTAFHYVGITDWKKYVKLDPKFKRPAELFENRGNPKKIKMKLGWKPKIKFEELVKMMVDADLKRLSSLNKK